MLLCRLVSSVSYSGCAWLSPGHPLALLMVPLCCLEHPGVSRADAMCELHHFFHRFLPWVCFLGSASVVIHPGAGSQPWSPSVCFAWLRTKTLSQLLTRLFREGMGASLPAAVSLATGCQALAGCSGQESCEREGDDGGGALMDQPRLPPSIPCPFINPPWVMAAFPLHFPLPEDLFLPEVTL